MANDAKKKMHSHTYLTQKLNLYEVKGGFGNGSHLFDKQRHSELITSTKRRFVETNEDGDYQVSQKQEGFGLQCLGPHGNMRTPKSALTTDPGDSTL